MSLTWKAIMARGGGGFERLGGKDEPLGAAWDRAEMVQSVLSWAGAARLGSGPPIDTGAGAAARSYYEMNMERIMRTALHVLSTSRPRGNFLLTLKPSGVFRRNWNQERYSLAFVRPEVLVEGCIEQLADAGLNRQRPLAVLAMTLSSMANMRGNGEISAQLELST